MSSNIVELPYKYYPDPTKGKPVYLGYIYVGKPNTDPEVLINRKVVNMTGSCVCPDEGTEISQPIRTSAGGVPEFNGSPVILSTDGNYSIKVLNSKGNQVYYAASVSGLSEPDTVADLVAESLTVGTIVSTGGYYVKGDSGAASYLIVASQAADEKGDHTIANGNVAKLIVNSPNGVPVEKFGFTKGGTHVSNGASVQAAIIWAKVEGSATITFNDYSDGLVNCGSNIQLHRGIKLQGGSPNAEGAGGDPWDSGLRGDGTGPIFITSPYPSTPTPDVPSLIREITFENMVASNTNGHPVAEAFSPSFHVMGGRFETFDSETFKFRFSFRSSVQGGRHRSTWSTPNTNNYTITAYDNCNGFVVTPDVVISGGTNGGGVDVTQSQKVELDGIYETMGNFGIRVGGYDGAEQGNCNAVSVAGYLEACEGSISIGAINKVTGLELGTIWANQFASATADSVIDLGRISGIRGGADISIQGNGTESAISFTQAPSGTGNLSAEEVYIEGVQTAGVLADIKIDAGIFNAAKAALFNGGRVQVGSSERTGVDREYFTPVIAANVGASSDTIFIPITATSGIISKVEILEAQGTLTGAVLRIGDTLNLSRNMNFSLDTAVITNGYSDITNGLSLTTLRTTEATTNRVIAGSGTGTFRIKITYRV